MVILSQNPDFQESILVRKIQATRWFIYFSQNRPYIFRNYRIDPKCIVFSFNTQTREVWLIMGLDVRPKVRCGQWWCSGGAWHMASVAAVQGMRREARRDGKQREREGKWLPLVLMSKQKTRK